MVREPIEKFFIVVTLITIVVCSFIAGYLMDKNNIESEMITNINEQMEDKNLLLCDKPMYESQRYEFTNNLSIVPQAR